jgi:hypothetical protein
MRHLCLSLLLVLGTSGAIAQTICEPLRGVEIVSDAVELDTKRTGRAQFFDPQDGQLDLSYFLEKPRGFLPFPIVVTERAVGYGGGIAGMFLRPRPEAGDEGWTRPDVSARSICHAQRTVYTRPGRALPAAIRGGRCAGELTTRTRVAAGGLRYVRTDVDPKPRENANFATLADQVRVKVSAPTAIVEFDTRDNVFTSTRGIYAESSWLASGEALRAVTISSVSNRCSSPGSHFPMT